jgi:hypothetical protein
MSVGNEPGIVGEIQIDLKRLHETWMELVYPRQRGGDDSVLGKWTPNTSGQMALYRTWSALGVPVIAVVYPLVLLGAIIRFQTRRIDGTVARLGLVGVVLLSLVVWGALTALAQYRLEMTAGGVVAIAAAGGVATLSAALALGTRRAGGRGTTVLLSYPFAMTAIFLPPVVAALFSPAIGDLVLPGSRSFANVLLDNVAKPIGLYEFFVDNFSIEGVGYALMWLGISVPLGWILGLLVTLADLARPTE